MQFSRCWVLLQIAVTTLALKRTSDTDGWAQQLKYFRSGTGSRCNIERVPVEALANYKGNFIDGKFAHKPVIITFPEGADSWTDSKQWTFEALSKKYKDRKMTCYTNGARTENSGDLEKMTMKTYIEKIMPKVREPSKDPPDEPYIFGTCSVCSSHMPDLRNSSHMRCFATCCRCQVFH
jgi:hypothetical protein